MSLPRRIPFVRRVALACVGTGLVSLGACSQSGSHEASREIVGERTQELVTQTAYYVGASNMASKQLALTFDDGPAARTSELSAYLKAQNIRATFFVNGACIQATALPNESCGSPLPGAATVLAQLAADGHLVANHSTTHRDITTIPVNQRVQELADTDALITMHGKTPWNRSLFRAPYGEWSSAVFDTLSTSTMAHYVGPIYWDIGGGPTNATRAADWECWIAPLNLTVQQCGDRYRNEIATIGRGIVLMHDLHSQTVDMVKYLVPLLKADGYTFVRADEVPRIAADFPACGVTGCSTCSGPGATQCTTCTIGRYLSGGACSPCSSCAAGTYTAAACTATTNTVCTACDASCATCTGAGPAACATCAAGRYLSGTTCNTCTTCAPGTYASTACTATTDTVCTACHPSCVTCSGPAASDCGTCPSGFFRDGGSCTACAVCAAGTYASSACTANSDTVCTPCAAGSYTSSAGATSCTSCGSCDDGDPCTADSCSPAAGCTHAPIPGCPAGPSDAAAPSVPFDDGSDSSSGVGEESVREGESGCNASSRTRAPTASIAIAVAGLLAFRRRRRGHARG